MSTPFTDPYSETATFHDLVGELALAFYQRRHALLGPDDFPNSLQDNADVQAWWYWANMQGVLLGMIGRPNWVKYKSYSTWPPPVYANNEEVFAAAGLPPTGFRRATAWDGVTDPVWQYGQMQAGDIIGPWIIEDLQKLLSVLRWGFWAGEDVALNGTPAISTIQQYYVGASYRQPTRAEAQAEAESFYRLLHTADYYRTVQRSIWEHTLGENYEATLYSTRLTINFNLSADLIDCAREIILYAYVEAHGTFDSFGDYAAPGYNHIADYPAGSGAVPPIELGTADKPLPWRSADGLWGYDARPQMLIKWDFTNCNEV